MTHVSMALVTAIERIESALDDTGEIQQPCEEAAAVVQDLLASRRVKSADYFPLMLLLKGAAKLAELGAEDGSRDDIALLSVEAASAAVTHFNHITGLD